MSTATEVSDSAYALLGERLSGKKVQSFMDKLNDITTNDDGTITHNVYLKGDKTPRTFKNLQTYQEWKRQHIK